MQVRFLLRRGASPDARTLGGTGPSAIDLAEERCLPEVFSLLEQFRWGSLLSTLMMAGVVAARARKNARARRAQARPLTHVCAHAHRILATAERALADSERRQAEALQRLDRVIEANTHTCRLPSTCPQPAYARA